MNKIGTKIMIVSIIGNMLISLSLFLQLKELESRFVVLHDDFNLVTPKFSNDILGLSKKLKDKK